jgi:hypothetical protein
MSRPGAFDPGEAPPEPEQALEPKDAGPVESFRDRALRRAQEEEMRKQLDLGWFGMLSDGDDGDAASIRHWFV